MNESSATTSDAQPVVETDQEQDLVSAMPPAVQVSEKLRKIVDAVGRFGSWMIIPLVMITVIDVILRKIGIQYWLITNVGRMFDSTVLQEEVNSLRRENEALAATKTQITSRLDSAIDNIRTVLEA